MKTTTVDQSLFVVVPEFGCAGGPLVHRLTEAGRMRAFRVGSGTTEAGARVLSAISIAGTAAIETRSGARLTLTDFGRIATAEATSALVDRGLISLVTGTTRAYQITANGLAAAASGEAECARLLARVRAAHPIH